MNEWMNEWLWSVDEIIPTAKPRNIGSNTSSRTTFINTSAWTGLWTKAGPRLEHAAFNLLSCATLTVCTCTPWCLYMHSSDWNSKIFSFQYACYVFHLLCLVGFLWPWQSFVINVLNFEGLRDIFELANVYERGLLAPCPVSMLENLLSTLFNVLVLMYPSSLAVFPAIRNLNKRTHDVLTFLITSSSPFVKWSRKRESASVMRIYHSSKTPSIKYPIRQKSLSDFTLYQSIRVSSGCVTERYAQIWNYPELFRCARENIATNIRKQVETNEPDAVWRWWV
jgi:hypothetical protein